MKNSQIVSQQQLLQLKSQQKRINCIEMMNTAAVQFRRFKSDINFKQQKLKTNIDKIYDYGYQNTKKQDIPSLSPQRQPTSFRELSGSRDKNKIFSGKKKALQNKLSTLRSNQKNTMFDISCQEKSIPGQFDSGKKEGLFTKLLTSRSPQHARSKIGDESNGSVNTNDSSGISFSAFKGVMVGENQNYANLVLHKKTESEKQDKDKGLKFRAFPHKKISMGNPSNPQAQKQRQQVLLAQGPLICQKGQSRSKGKNIEILKQKRSPLKSIIPIQNCQAPVSPRTQIRKVLTMNQYGHNQYGLLKQSTSNQSSHHQADQVIRSRDSSMAFDMSPTLC